MLEYLHFQRILRVAPVAGPDLLLQEAHAVKWLLRFAAAHLGQFLGIAECAAQPLHHAAVAADVVWRADMAERIDLPHPHAVAGTERRHAGARFVHDAGAVAIQQILHAGRYGGIDLGYCLQPSVVPQTLPHFRPPREITKDQIRETIRQHADAAQRSIRAGFDGTEVTSFMGYLLANFNSRFTNQRTDEYGGTTLNRGRFMRELIDGIKQATPDHPLVVRLNGAELMDKWGGNTEDECFELMQQAVDVGVDMISVTVGWQEAPESSIGRDIPPGHWNRLARRAKQLLPNVPIAFGVLTTDDLDQALARAGGTEGNKGAEAAATMPGLDRASIVVILEHHMRYDLDGTVLGKQLFDIIEKFADYDFQDDDARDDTSAFTGRR